MRERYFFIVLKSWSIDTKIELLYFEACVKFLLQMCRLSCIQIFYKIWLIYANGIFIIVLESWSTDTKMEFLYFKAFVKFFLQMCPLSWAQIIFLI